MTSWKLQRLIAGISRPDVARGTGITVAQLASIEKGARKPTADEVEKLIGVLNGISSPQVPQVKDSTEQAK